MEKRTEKAGSLKGKIDWPIVFIPLVVIVTLAVLFFLMPAQSTAVLDTLRWLLGDRLGSWYMVVGLGIFLFTMVLAFSKYGSVKLGNLEKPEYSTFRWGSMIFTSTMAADILFYSLCEWTLYAAEPHVEAMGGMQKWASTFPLFHWGPTPWSIYIALAVAFAFMLHVRGRTKQKFSEACRPVLGSKVDGVWGTVINLVSAFALLAGTATTFSLATPLLSAALASVFGIPTSLGLTICMLLLIAIVYTVTVWFGMKAIARLAVVCVYVFFALLAYVFFGGGQGIYIVETGISAIGNLAQNFIGLSTWMDPLRETSFPQNWTVFYWAYWMVWCVATPFFIGAISKGRTIRNVIVGGYACALSGTFLSFIVLGNYGLSQQTSGALDSAGAVAGGADLTGVILNILGTLPFPKVISLILVVSMVMFYATTFDALTMVMSIYSYKNLGADEAPDRRMRTFWSALFIVLPIALLFAQNSMKSLQSVSIIAAFPVSIVIVLIIVSFMKDIRTYKP